MVVKANLFDERLKAASDYTGIDVPRFILVMVSYQKKMETTLEDFRNLAARFS